MRIIWLFAVALLLTFTLAACGNVQPSTTETKDPVTTDKKDNNEPVKTVEYAQGVTDEEVVIGTIGVQSGPLAFIGTPYFNGMDAYINMVNDNGGVNGRKVKLIKKDDEFRAESAVQAMEALVYTDKVFSIVGQLGTPGVMATLNIVEEEGIPSVYFGSGASELTEAGENFFPVQPNYFYEGKLMSKYAMDEFDAETVVVIYSNDDVGRDGLDGVKEGLKLLGKEDALIEELSFNAGDTDFTVQVQRARSANPDVVILYGLAGEVTGLLRQIENLEFDVPMITTYSNADASFLTIASQSAPKQITSLYLMGWVDATAEGLTPLIDAMEKYFPGAPVNAYTMAGWVAAETFIAGLEHAGDNLSWDGYIQTMNELTFTDGLAPEISYANGRREGVTKLSLSKVSKNDAGEYFFELKTGFMEFE
jgi:branched-chain amino acid transport system substrate-binding protein